MPAKMIKTDKPFTVFSVEADIDYLSARMLAFLGNLFHARAGYLGHQACEKYLKALCVQKHNSYLETHKLMELMTAIENNYEFAKHENAKADLQKFDVFAQVGRYGAATNYDPLSKGMPVAGAQFHPSKDVEIAGARFWEPQHLLSLDRFVFNARTKLVYNNYDDGLLSVMTGNQRSMLVGTWSGPIPIKEVLTRNNKYFTDSNVETIQT